MRNVGGGEIQYGISEHRYSYRCLKYGAHKPLFQKESLTFIDFFHGK